MAKPRPDIQTKLGVVVRTRRKLLGITQDELGWRSDMHRTYIADVERGARNVTLRSIVNLAKALQLTVGSLLSQATGQGTPSSGTEKGPQAPESGEILLIEDNASDATMAARAFKRARFTNPVRVAKDAETALDRLFGTGRGAPRSPALPQVILLDLNLPGMSGLEFLRRIKADRRTRDIPVVVLTVSRTDRMIVECGRLGAADYIVKPIGIESFVRLTPRLRLNLTVARREKAGPRMALA
jgi:CheY-like chemotaxis protein